MATILTKSGRTPLKARNHKSSKIGQRVKGKIGKEIHQKSEEKRARKFLISEIPSLADFPVNKKGKHGENQGNIELIDTGDSIIGDFPELGKLVTNIKKSSSAGENPSINWANHLSNLLHQEGNISYKRSDELVNDIVAFPVRINTEIKSENQVVNPVLENLGKTLASVNVVISEEAKDISASIMRNNKEVKAENQTVNFDASNQGNLIGKSLVAVETGNVAQSRRRRGKQVSWDVNVDWKEPKKPTRKRNEWPNEIRKASGDKRQRILIPSCLLGARNGHMRCSDRATIFLSPLPSANLADRPSLADAWLFSDVAGGTVAMQIEPEPPPIEPEPPPIEPEPPPIDLQPSPSTFGSIHTFIQPSLVTDDEHDLSSNIVANDDSAHVKQLVSEVYHSVIPPPPPWVLAWDEESARRAAGRTSVSVARVSDGVSDDNTASAACMSENLPSLTSKDPPADDPEDFSLMNWSPAKARSYTSEYIALVNSEKGWLASFKKRIALQPLDDAFSYQDEWEVSDEDEWETVCSGESVDVSVDQLDEVVPNSESGHQDIPDSNKLSTVSHHDITDTPSLTPSAQWDDKEQARTNYLIQKYLFSGIPYDIINSSDEDNDGNYERYNEWNSYMKEQRQEQEQCAYHPAMDALMEERQQRIDAICFKYGGYHVYSRSCPAANAATNPFEFSTLREPPPPSAKLQGRKVSTKVKRVTTTANSFSMYQSDTQYRLPVSGSSILKSFQRVEKFHRSKRVKRIYPAVNFTISTIHPRIRNIAVPSTPRVRTKIPVNRTPPVPLYAPGSSSAKSLLACIRARQKKSCLTRTIPTEVYKGFIRLLAQFFCIICVCYYYHACMLWMIGCFCNPGIISIRNPLLFVCFVYLIWVWDLTVHRNYIGRLNVEDYL